MRKEGGGGGGGGRREGVKARGGGVLGHDVHAFSYQHARYIHMPVVPVLPFQVSGFGFRVSGVGFRVQV